MSIWARPVSSIQNKRVREYNGTNMRLLKKAQKEKHPKNTGPAVVKKIPVIPKTPDIRSMGTSSSGSRLFLDPAQVLSACKTTQL